MKKMKINGVPAEYSKPFDKTTSIKATLDGFAVVNIKDITSNRYKGEYLMFRDKKFVEVSDFSITSIKVKEFDWNKKPSYDYVILQFVDQIIPKKLWKMSETMETPLTEIYFSRIHSQGHTESVHGNTLWAVCEYKDSKGKRFSVKFDKNYTSPTVYYHDNCIDGFRISTKKVYRTLKSAKDGVRDWVYDNVKTSKKAQSIVEIHPEIFV